MLSFSQELHALIEAGYPYLWLVTWEEERVTSLVAALSAALQRPITTWRPEEGPGRPEASLDAFLEELAAATRPQVALLFDAHPYLDDVARVRRLRLLQRALAKTRSTCVFVAPQRVTPVGLERDWTVLDVPLPDRVELCKIVEDVLGEAGVSEETEVLRIADAALGLTARQARRALDKAKHLQRLARARRQPFAWAPAVHREKRSLLTAGGALELWQPEETMRDVGGLDALKEWIAERRRVFDPDARAFGLPEPKGLLMLGVQGCGKSLAAKAVANDWGLPLLRLDLSSLFLGGTAPDRVLRDALRTAEAMAPSILWVDELEKGLDTGGDAGANRLLGALLTWMQEKRSPVFFVATANKVDRLPPELLRRGRFDEIFFVDLPDTAARAEILAIHLQRKQRDPSTFDLNELAKFCQHFSGAELEQVVVAALHRCFAHEVSLTDKELLLAARTVVPLYRLYEEEIKALRTWADGRARPACLSRRLSDYFRTPSSNA